MLKDVFFLEKIKKIKISDFADVAAGGGGEVDAKMAGKMAAEGGTDAWLTVRRFAADGKEAKKKKSKETKSPCVCVFVALGEADLWTLYTLYTERERERERERDINVHIICINIYTNKHTHTCTYS